MAAEAIKFYGTGRRKSSVARVWLMPGDGKIEVNKRPVDDYFPRATLRMIMQQPLETVGKIKDFNIYANVSGGGSTGQAGAIRLGIARALLEANPEYRAALRKAGFLTRDPRAKERKKYGQRGARARFQFSKR